jgi:hypothetical protein
MDCSMAERTDFFSLYAAYLIPPLPHLHEHVIIDPSKPSGIRVFGKSLFMLAAGWGLAVAALAQSAVRPEVFGLSRLGLGTDHGPRSLSRARTPGMASRVRLVHRPQHDAAGDDVADPERHERLTRTIQAARADRERDRRSAFAYSFTCQPTTHASAPSRKP